MWRIGNQYQKWQDNFGTALVIKIEISFNAINYNIFKK